MTLAETWKDGPTLAYTVFRFTMGINFFMHGAVRIFGHYGGFAKHLTGMFDGTWLPGWWTAGFAWAVPPVELVVGALLVLGLRTREALAAGGLLMACFVFGACVVEKWSLVGSQTIYVIAFYLLLRDIHLNRCSLDAGCAGQH